MRLILRASVLAVCAVSSLAPVAAQAPEAAASLTLDAAVATALKDNPSLRALRLSRQVGEAEVRVAGQRPNPDVVYEAARETPNHALTLAVPIETGGKRNKRMAAAGAVTHTTDAEIALAEADLRASVRQAFFGLVAAQGRVSITADLLAIGERARGAADARVRAGEAPRFELVQSELERARRDNDAAAALGALDAARADLNTLLGRVPTSTITADATLGEAIDVDAMLARLSRPHANIEVAVLDRRVDEAAARLDLTRALGVPDPTVQASLTYRSPPDFTYGWRTGVSLTVPLFSRNTAPVARDTLALEHARALRNAGQQTADGRTSAAAARVRSLAAQQSREATVLMPRSLEMERMAEDAYRAGQIDLTALLQTLQTGRDVRLRALDTTLALQVAVADLERAAGVVLP